MLVFNMMNEKLKDKVVAIELAGNNILIANDNDNFKNELISIGFEKVEPYYSISMPTDDVEKRAFKKLTWILIALLYLTLIPVIFHRPEEEGAILVFWEFLNGKPYHIVLLLIFSFFNLLELKSYIES